MPPMMLITYLAIKAYPVCWFTIVICKYLLKIEICSDNALALMFVVLTFNAIMFTNRYKYFDLNQKIMIAIPPIYYLLLSLDKITFNLLPNNNFNPIIGIVIVIIILLSIYFDHD